MRKTWTGRTVVAGGRGTEATPAARAEGGPEATPGAHHRVGG